MKTINTAVLMKPMLIALIFVSLIPGASAQEQSAARNGQAALLMSFTGTTTGNAEAQLSWSMENLTNCKWFVIERSGSSRGFDSIGVVIGTNNTNHTDYTFVDEQLLSGNNYYRIRQVDMDGSSRYSRIVCLYNSTKNAPRKIQVYPNPAISVVNYTLTSPEAALATVQVYSMSGVLVLTQQQQLASGVNQQSVAISTLKTGNYFLKVSSQDGTRYEQSFIKLM